MKVNITFLFISLHLASLSSAFLNSSSHHRFSTSSLVHTTTTTNTKNKNAWLYLSSSSSIDDDTDDDEIEVGKMRVSEMKSELKMRGVDFSDCFDKESLAFKLREARATGKADPSIIDQFNKQRLENTYNEKKVEIDDDKINDAVAGDGTLPGGMPPDMLKSLMSNPELMTLMQNSKMQDVMKLMMTKGQSAVEQAMVEDREIYEIVTKLNSIMGKAM